MAQVGDLVRYGQSGVCRVEEIREMELGGEKQEYFVLIPLYKSGVVYVPCGNEELEAKMLPLLTEKEIFAAVEEVSRMDSEWIRDFRRRSDLSKKALSSGDRKEALYLIKNIYDHRMGEQKEGKRIHTTDDYFLRDAENLIFSEFSFVLGKSVEEVSAMVKKSLGIEE